MSFKITDVREFTHNFNGDVFVDQRLNEKWNELVERIVKILNISCKTVKIQIWPKSKGTDSREELKLSSNAFITDFVFDDDLAGCLEFCGIDCISKKRCSEEDLILLQNTWRKFLISAYNMKDEMKKVLEKRKQEAIKKIDEDYEQDILGLN